jgi:OmcA/MtrC family decaheme c-type cytochrome
LLLVAGCGSSKKEGAEAPVLGTVSPTGNIQASIQSVVISSPTSTPVVTLTLLDEKGAPLDPNAIIAAGGRFRLYIAQLAPDANGDYQYRNYLKTSANLPTYDSGGTITALGNGVYSYTFKTNITDSTKTLNNLVYDPARTHTVAAQISRTVASPTGSSFSQAVNPFLTFVPDGSAVTYTREITPISACNGCHGKLGVHGGTRIEVALCILCHNPGVKDPDTGNSVEMKSMIHKIHMGENLPSNEAGGEYGIGGTSFKTVVYPTICQPYSCRVRQMS